MTDQTRAELREVEEYLHGQAEVARAYLGLLQDDGGREHWRQALIRFKRMLSAVSEALKETHTMTTRTCPHDPATKEDTK